ncbi:MAG: hypothetical protein JKY32_05630 [Rhizobiales bacterium]|nr:hypothetical protein [Hyphomicrobiales bacterium]
MSFEDIQAEIALLINEMDTQPHDLHELQLQIHQKLSEMKAFGMPLPADLVALEKDLDAYFSQKPKA